MRWLLVVLVVAGCASEAEPDRVPEAVSSSTTQDEVSLGELRESLLGTVACPDDPGCPLVESVRFDGGRLEVVTDLFPDSDATGPALAVCVAATGLVDEPVWVYGNEGTILARGQEGRTPICDKP